MELEEIKKLRKQIREVLLNSDELKDIDSLKNKNNFQELKKDCYIKLVDLKNDFETVEENPDNGNSIKKIDGVIAALERVKRGLSNQI
jgi:hypothetical protein